MRINRIKLFNYLRKKHISLDEFVKDLGWTIEKITKILYHHGQVNRDDAETFVYKVGASEAYEIINWRAMNVRKPKYNTIFQPSYTN